MAPSHPPPRIRAPRRRTGGLWCVSLLLASTAMLPAHDSPEHVVTTLTRRMGESGPTPELLYRRGVEYRVLGQWSKAAADLEGALNRDPRLLPARLEWAKVLLIQGRTPEARQAIEEGLAQTGEKEAVGALMRVRAEIQAQAGDWARALADSERALQTNPGDLDGYLLRGQLQRRLGRHGDAVRGFQEGFTRTGSFVLKNEWIESLIDAGCCRQALAEIESELVQSRWKSSWLLRRARARICLDDRPAATADLRAAIEEIDRRFNPRRPDLALLADRGLARALMGDTERARADCRQAKEAGAEDWVLERLERALEEPEVGPVRGDRGDRDGEG